MALSVNQTAKVMLFTSCKGGVGKSMVTSLLAAETQRRGFQTAILDADVTGPSIPKAFGIHAHASGVIEAERLSDVQGKRCSEKYKYRKPLFFQRADDAGRLHCLFKTVSSHLRYHNPGPFYDRSLIFSH